MLVCQDCKNFIKTNTAYDCTECYVLIDGYKNKYDPIWLENKDDFYMDE